MLGEPDGHDPRTPELDKNLVVVGRIEPHGDVAGPLLSQEVDATQKGKHRSPPRRPVRYRSAVVR